MLQGSEKGKSLLAKLEARNNVRKQTATDARAASRDNVRSDEHVEAFLISWSAAEEDCREKILALSRSLGQSQNTDDDLDQAKALNSIKRLEQELARALSFLPSYHAKSCSDTLQSLRQNLEGSRAKALPKKKFSFAGKKAARNTQDETQMISDAQTSQSTFEVPDSAKQEDFSENDTNGSVQQIETRETDAHIRLVQHRLGEVLSINLDEMPGSVTAIENLAKCQVHLKGNSSALRVEACKECDIWLEGFVSGSAFMTGLEDCRIVAAASQVRIHHSTNTEFFLAVRGSPIIENCEKVRFGPNRGSNSLLGDSQSNGHSENWSKVQDFGWLRSTQSPHWSMITHEEAAQKVQDVIDKFQDL